MMALSPRSLELRPILLADAVVTGATALLMLAGASPLADLLDLPTALLAGAGAVLAPYVAFLLWLARREEPPRGAVLAVIGANIAWAVGCIAMLFSGQVEPNALGVAFVLIQAVAVLVFADLQYLTLRGRPVDRRNRERVLEV